MSGFARSLFFNSIYIVQFLSDKDVERTGRELYTHLALVCHEAGVNLAFADVATTEEFLGVLAEIVDHCRQNRAGPILHLETHGNSRGLGASATEFLPWSALVPSLTELNRLSKMNLLVTMAACHGLHLVQTLMPGDESPAWAILGPYEQVLPSDIRRCFQAFYRTLVTNQNLNAALEALKAADKSWPDSWKFQNAELYFAYVFGLYLNTYADPREFESRVAECVDRLVLHGVSETDALRASVRTAFADEEGAFDFVKRQFVMLDRYPDNEPRFPIDLAEVRRILALQREGMHTPPATDHWA